LAVGEAFHTIARGSADIMVVGATGTRVHPMKTAHAVLSEELADNRVEASRASRPFDRDRSGMVLGEGAGVVVLEELATAEARGSRIYAEVVGAGSAQVAYSNDVARRDKALGLVIRKSLAQAGIAPKDVGHIHAHGLATHSCDTEEAQAIREAFGDAASRIPVTAAKSYFGNLGAGSGAVELIASVLAIANRRLPPILNYQTPDPSCPIMAATAEHTDPGYSFVNLSVTPQGQASAVVVRQLA
jgi:3-oxoacyl-[acyl-carrier-protein] synthase II